MNKKVRKKNRRVKVPAATVVLYIIMVIIILGICTAVFFISFNALNSTDSGVPAVNNSIIGSSRFILPDNEINNSSVSDSSSESSSSDTQSESSSGEENSSSDSSSSTETSSSSSENSDSWSVITQPTSFNKEFFKDDLFIGDSIFTGLYGYKFLDKANVAAKVGYTPYGALNTAFDDELGVTALEYAKQRSPKRIFILLGSNALDSSALNALQNSYSNLLTTLKSEFPNAKICCISITPVARQTNYPNIKNSDVKLMNEYIREQCKALRLDYYDLYSAVSDEDGYFLEEYAEIDGMHFSGITYRVMLSALQKKYS
ncbi:MAG: hypothetical protein J1F04_00570 [Oscillospiraceae bacterium]|nr:hypothetical protein [Oscillospiraceae bacterium]